MKALTLISAGAVLLVSLPWAHADSIRPQLQNPCFSVNIQHDSTNKANTRQSCDRNVNRTVQVGRDNGAHTIQTGQINDNKARQYRYDRSTYLDRLHPGQ